MIIKLLKLPLTLVSYLWELAYSLRRFSYMVRNSDSESLAPPVISVGNIAFGGTGKTPFIVWLSQYLQGLDRDIVIATRGYRSKMENAGGIIELPSKEIYSASIYGDEPILIGENLKRGRIIVGKERFTNLRRFLKDDEQNTVVLLDDGFQHLKLNRDLNIVLFDAALDIDRYYCPPRGYLREGVSSLKDADIIALSRVELVSEEQLDRLQRFLRPYTRANTPFIHFNYNGEYLTDISGKKVASESFKWFAFSGIASPKSFTASLGKIGCEVVGEKHFPDHFNYTVDHINELKKLARESGAKLVCTEKDAVKLKEIDSSLEVYFLKIVVQITHGTKELHDIINRAISY